MLLIKLRFNISLLLCRLPEATTRQREIGINFTIDRVPWNKASSHFSKVRVTTPSPSLSLFKTFFTWETSFRALCCFSNTEAFCASPPYNISWIFSYGNVSNKCVTCTQRHVSYEERLWFVLICTSVNLYLLSSNNNKREWRNVRRSLATQQSVPLLQS